MASNMAFKSQQAEVASIGGGSKLLLESSKKGIWGTEVCLS